jgi:ferric-dicitrate binding protein FerR (iron transport regulator)
MFQLWQQTSPPFNHAEAEDSFSRHVARMEKTGSDFNEHHEIETEESVEEYKTGKVKKWLLPAVAVAAIALLIIVVKNNYGRAAKTNLAQHLSQVTTKPGSKTQIQLPDGSKVWLNASSNLTYNKEFGKTFREVELTGEAFFDVVKDPSHPFIIHTKVIDVKVLGTEFNVRSYPNDANTETSLIRGSVEVTVKNRGEKYYLKPNEKVVIANHPETENNINSLVKKAVMSEPLVSIQPLSYYKVDSTILETSWVDNKLIFQQNETFREVALKMERWYGVVIHFADEKVAEYRPFGSFTKETITQALDALQVSFKFNYKINGDDVTITQ